MTAYTLRVSKPGDETAVTALTQASYGMPMPEAYDQSLFNKLLPIISKGNPRLLASGTYFLAITPDGEVIGSGGWSREQTGTRELREGLGHIRHFAIHPAWIGRGIG